MESSGYYKCEDCGQVLDRKRFPEDQPCPYCDEQAYEQDKTYRGSRARRLPGVSRAAAAEGAKRREKQNARLAGRSVTKYFWAGMALLTLGVLLPLATPMFYKQTLEVELARTTYITGQVPLLNELSTKLMADGNMWPQAAAAIAGTAPGGILSYVHNRLAGGAALCRWIALVSGLLGGAGVAMLYLRAMQWPEFRPRAHLLCLAILLGVIGLNYTGARYMAHARSADYISNKNDINTMMGMLVYAELTRKNGLGAVTHLSNGAPRNFIDGRGATYLHVAAENGANDTIETLVQWGLDSNGSDNEGRTPLHYAAGNGQTFAADALIVRGARLSARDDIGRGVLHFAAARNNMSMLKNVLDRGADVNARDDEGRTPLIVAAESGNADGFTELLVYGADLEDRDADGHTLLQVTLLNVLDRMYLEFSSLKEGGHAQLDIFRTLLENGADVNAVDSVSQTPLHWVRDARNRIGEDEELQDFLDQLVELLIYNGADYTATDLAGEPAYTLHDAAKIGQATVAAKLIDSNLAGIHDRDAFDRTPFQIAVQRGFIDVAKLLLDNGANPNEWAIPGETALNHAIDHGNTEMVRMLLENGSRITQTTVSHEGPILRAARRGVPEILQLLLEAGGRINEQNPQGNNALHLAADGGHEEAVKLLLARGADTTAWNRAGRTPLDMAEAAQRKRVASILRRLPTQVSPASNLIR